jgi:hypothetical protein
LEERFMFDPNSLADRLRRRAVVDSQTGCWLWQGASNGAGYGILALRRAGRQRLVRVHRVALYVWGEQPLFGKAVVSCCRQSRRCFNPEHLTVRRQAQPQPRPGQANGRAKLTEAEARRLLEAYQRQALSPAELARLVGDKVRPSTVEALLKGRTWRHLPRARHAALST